MGLDGIGWDGMGWDEMGWDGMEWDGMGWAGPGWIGLGWEGRSWQGMGWDGMGRNGMAWDGMACGVGLGYCAGIDYFTYTCQGQRAEYAAQELIRQRRDRILLASAGVRNFLGLLRCGNAAAVTHSPVTRALTIRCGTAFV